MKLGHIGTLILICGIGMSCLAIPIPDTMDNRDNRDNRDDISISEFEFSNSEPWGWGGLGRGRALLKSKAPAKAPAQAPAKAPAKAPAQAPAQAPAKAPASQTTSRHTVHHTHNVRAGTRRHVVHTTTKVTKVTVVTKPVKPVVVVKTAALPAALPVVSVAANNVKKQETAQDKWLATVEGARASQFCKSLGIENKPQIYDGCLEDMMVMKSEEIARLGALTAEEFLAKEKSADNSKRYCIASGDPHFTSYDRDIYHLQEEGIFEIAGSDDDKFEVQERVKKNGANKPGVPCCMIGAVVRFGDVYVEVDVYNYGKIRVNGVSVDLAKDTTKTYGGVKVRYGKQNIAWRGAKAQTTAMTIAGPGGFSVMIEGGYCGTLEVNVPSTYFGKMKGLCGNADGTATNADFSSPDGKVMDVKRGAKDWQMSGYGGPTSPLSKWQLSWKPTGVECLFASGCETLPATAVPIAMHAKRNAEKVAAANVKDKVVVAPVAPAAPAAPVAPAAPAAPVAPVVPVVPVAVPTPTVISPTASVAAASKSSTSASSGSHSQHLVVAIHKFHKDTQSKMHDLKTKIDQLLKQNAEKQRDELKQSEQNYKNSKQDADAVSLKYDLYAKRLASLKNDIVLANGTFISHYNAMMSDNAYLLKLQLFKPSFIATLEHLKTTLAGLESGVNGLIGLKPDEKDELSRLMFKLRNSTYARTDEVAHDFLQFLEKHKSVLTADTSKTDAAKKKLDDLQKDYADTSKLSKAAYEEYLKFARIVAELKLQFAATASETELFEELMHRVAAMLQQSGTAASTSKCTATSFIHDDARKSCAVDLLKSHSHNNLI